MTHVEVKQQLDALLDELPGDKAQLLLDFAEFLKQQARAGVPPTPQEDWTDRERAIIAAEEYWFSLPEETRRAYVGRMAAVIEGRILDADSNIRELEARIRAQYPDQPVLYIEGEAEQFPALFIRSPRLR